jgi:hypothetical protein
MSQRPSLISPEKWRDIRDRAEKVHRRKIIRFRLRLGMMAVASFAALYGAVAVIPPRFTDWAVPLFLLLAGICVASVVALAVPLAGWGFEKYFEMVDWRAARSRKMQRSLYRRVYRAMRAIRKRVRARLSERAKLP